MNILQRTPLAIILALAFANLAYANDPPKADAKPADAKAGDPKAADAKPAAPAEPDLPSKPFPKVGVLPKPAEKPADKPVAKATEKPAEKAAEKPADKPAEKTADKPAAKASDKHAADSHDKPAELAAVQPEAPVKPKKRKPAVKHASVSSHASGSAHGGAHSPLKDVAREVVSNNAHGQSADMEAYFVEANDTLDKIIKKTFPTTPFSDDVMREAFIKSNPQALADGKGQKLRPGQMLRVPDAAMFRLVVLGEVGPPPAAAHGAHGAAGGHGSPTEVAKKDAAPVVAPEPSLVPTPTKVETLAVPRQAVFVASSANPPAEVTSEEKKKWVRYP